MAAQAQAHYRDYGKMTYARSVFIIHNIAHQGRGPLAELSGLEVSRQTPVLRRDTMLPQPMCYHSLFSAALVAGRALICRHHIHCAPYQKAMFSTSASGKEDCMFSLRQQT